MDKDNAHPAKTKDKIAVFSTESIEDGTACLTNTLPSGKFVVKMFEVKVIESSTDLCSPSMEETSTLNLSVKTVESAVKETHSTCESKNVSSCGEVDNTFKDGV